MSKLAPRTAFKKGKSGNIKGRPKGSKSASTIEWSKVRQLARKDYVTAYAELRGAMQSGEGWAFNLYFKELVPKKVYTDTVLLELEDASLECRITAITQGLLTINEITYEEAMRELAVLSNTKIAEKMQNIEDSKLTDNEDYEYTLKAIAIRLKEIDENKKKALNTGTKSLG